MVTAAIVGAGFIGPVHAEALRRLGITVRGIATASLEESRQAAQKSRIPVVLGRRVTVDQKKGRPFAKPPPGDARRASIEALLLECHAESLGGEGGIRTLDTAINRILP